MLGGETRVSDVVAGLGTVMNKVEIIVIDVRLHPSWMERAESRDTSKME